MNTPRRMQRILITAGGTGGHVFPALAAAKQFQEEGIETMRFCGWVLLVVSLACGGGAAWVIGRQNRSVK